MFFRHLGIRLFSLVHGQVNSKRLLVQSNKCTTRTTRTIDFATPEFVHMKNSTWWLLIVLENTERCRINFYWSFKIQILEFSNDCFLKNITVSANSVINFHLRQVGWVSVTLPGGWGMGDSAIFNLCIFTKQVSR